MQWTKVKRQLEQALSAYALGRYGEAEKFTKRLYASVRRAKKRGTLDHWRADWLLYDLKQAVICFRCGEWRNALLWLQSANRYVWMVLRGEA